MKKVELQNRRTVEFDIIPSKSSSRSRSFKCLSTSSKNSEKSEKQHTSRVKFKESFENALKNSQNVQFVRNIEHPVKKARTVVNFTPGLRSKACQPEISQEALSSRISEDVTSIRLDDGLDDKNLRLNVPELCTSLRIANKLLEEAAAESKTTFGRTNWESSSSKNLRAKVLKKVNFPFEEQIYKDLVDLKVTEQDLFSGQEKKIKSKNFERTKDQEPDLSAFYKPTYDEEFILKMEKLKIEPDSTIHYDGFSLSDRLKNWDIGD